MSEPASRPVVVRLHHDAGHVPSIGGDHGRLQIHVETAGHAYTAGAPSTLRREGGNGRST